MNVPISVTHHSLLEKWVAQGEFNSVEEAISRMIEDFQAKQKLKEEIQIGIYQADAGLGIPQEMVFNEIRKLINSKIENNDQ